MILRDDDTRKLRTAKEMSPTKQTKRVNEKAYFVDEHFHSSHLNRRNLPNRVE